MTDTQHEPTDNAGSIMGLTAGEIVAIIAFWAFLAVLTAAGLLVDPRVAAVAALRAALRPEIRSGIDQIALVEYGLWAVLTLPIFWMTRRFGGDRPTLDRILAFLVIGIVLAIGVDALLTMISHQLMPQPTLAPRMLPELSPDASRIPHPGP